MKTTSHGHNRNVKSHGCLMSLVDWRSNWQNKKSNIGTNNYCMKFLDLLTFCEERKFLNLPKERKAEQSVIFLVDAMSSNDVLQACSHKFYFIGSEQGYLEQILIHFWHKWWYLGFLAQVVIFWWFRITSRSPSYLLYRFSP